MLKFASTSAPASPYASVDGTFEKDRIAKNPGDPTRREFTYFVLGGARLVYASAARLALLKVIYAGFYPIDEINSIFYLHASSLLA